MREPTINLLLFAVPPGTNDPAVTSTTNTLSFSSTRPLAQTASNPRDDIHRLCAELRAAGAVPARCGPQVAHRVLERHLERQREAIEAVADLRRAYIEIRGADVLLRVAELPVEIHRDLRPSVAEARGERLESRRPCRAERRPHAWDPLAAVDVQAEVAAPLVHLVADAEDLWRRLGARVRPLPVQVGARRVRPEVAARTTVRVRVRHGEHRRGRPHRGGGGVGGAAPRQPVEQPLDEVRA